MRRLALAASLASLLAAQDAHAQDVPGVGEAVSADALADLPPREPTFWEGGGVKLGEMTYFHPRFELSTAYQTNVFSADDSDPRPGGGIGAIGAPLLRFGAGGSLETRRPDELQAEAASKTARRSVALRGDFDLTWHQYISDNVQVQDHNDLSIGLLFDARFNPEGELTFILKDGLTRAVRPPPVESLGDVNRLKNELTIGGLFKPGGGAIQGYGNYIFAVDLFERAQLNFGNRLTHTFNLGGKWQWLPKTQFNFDTFLGIVSPSDETVKAGSIPLRIWAGVSTLITPTFGTVLKLGVAYAAYDRGPNYLSYLALVEGRWALGPVTRFAFGYTHDFADALIGNYFSDHAFYARLAAQFAGRFQARAKGEVRLRDYDGIVDFGGAQFCNDAACVDKNRFDIVSRIEATLDYQFNAWLYAGVAYAFESVTTDAFIRANGDQDSSGYVWNEFLVKAQAKF